MGRLTQACIQVALSPLWSLNKIGTLRVFKLMQSFSSFGKLFQTDGAKKKISVDQSRFSLVVIEDVFHVLRDVYHERT